MTCGLLMLKLGLLQLVSVLEFWVLCCEMDDVSLGKEELMGFFPVCISSGCTWSNGIVYVVDELFRLLQEGHVHVSLQLPNLLYSVVDIPRQFLCIHWSHSSQAIDSCLHAFLQMPHGNLGRLGPGFGSIPPCNNNSAMILAFMGIGGGSSNHLLRTCLIQ